MVRYVVELDRELARHPDVALSVLTVPATRPLCAEMLRPEDRVHVLPDLPTPVRSLLERSGLGVQALDGRYDVMHGTKHLALARTSSCQIMTVHDLLPRGPARRVADDPQAAPRTAMVPLAIAASLASAVPVPVVWVRELLAALARPRPVSAGATVRTWAQVADESLRAVRDAGPRR